MTIQENLMAAGQWSVRLSKETPQNVLDKITNFSQVAVTEAPEDIRVAGDSVLSTALYVGLLRGTARKTDGVELSGAGLAVLLGDEDDKGKGVEDLLTFAAQTFTSTLTTMLTGQPIHVGTLNSVTGTFTGSFQYKTRRKAIDYVCSTMDAEWRVNGNNTLDAGTVAQLYPANPRAAIIAKARGLDTGTLRALPGTVETAQDVEDFTTKAVLLASSAETTIATGSATIGVNPYVDLYGNPLEWTRLISESETSSGNAFTRAQLQLNRFTSPRTAITLNSETHDVKGSLSVGEYVWVHDPAAQAYDYNNPVQWQGETIYPLKLRVTAYTWPVAEGRGVYLRTQSGEWLDLTPYVKFESGQTNVTVGGYNRSLVSQGAEPVSVRLATTQPNLSVPNAPTWTTPFVQSVYQSEESGTTRAQVILAWTLPTNTDGTAIVDGDHFDIRYRTTSQAILPATHAQMAGFTHAQLAAQTHGTPLPFTTGYWDARSVGWDTLNSMVSELTPGTPYEFQIRAVDNANPPNYSAWSTSTIFQTITDSIPPATPAPPTAFGSRIAIQVVHTLGRASGGTFNLDPDLNHLEVHAEYEPTFTPTTATLLGNISATVAELFGSIPVVRTFNVESTAPLYVKVIAVDHAGNRSGPSIAAQATADLIDSAHISDLTASKITAGTITASILNGGLFHTNDTGIGSDIGFDGLGFFGVDQNGDLFLDISDAGTYIRGHIESGVFGGRRIEINPDIPSIRFWLDTTQQRYALEPFSFNQPDDPADTPGIQLFGRNELGQLEGARAVYYEDGFYAQLANPGGASNTGGYLFSNRIAGGIGYHDTSTTAGDGWVYQAQAGAFHIQANKPNQEGGNIQGTSAAVWVGVNDSAGAFKCYASVDGTNQRFIVLPSGNGNGWFQVNNDAGGPANSARLQFLQGSNFGNLLKIFNTGVQIQFECRNVNDSGFVPIIASAFTVGSDPAGKKNVRDANLSALDKIRAAKVKKYNRKNGGPSRAATDGNGVSTTALDQDGPEEIGLLSTDVPPEMFRQASDGGAVDLYAMASHLWAGVQELAAENDDLRSRVTALEAAVDKLVKGKP